MSLDGVDREVSLGRGEDRALARPAPAKRVLSIPDRRMSGEHLAIIVKEGVTHVAHDRGSTNGTRVNGEKIAGPTPLRDGDVVTLGSTHLVYRRSSWTSRSRATSTPRTS